jgi:hypothetical protein
MGSGEGSGREGVGNGSKAVRARGLVAKLEMYSSQPPPFTSSPLHIALSTDDNLVVVLQGHSNTAQALQPPLVRASQRHHQAPSTHSHQPHQLDQYRLGILIEYFKAVSSQEQDHAGVAVELFAFFCLQLYWLSFPQPPTRPASHTVRNASRPSYGGT